MSAAKPIEDMYPLTPMQSGMLFHALYAPHSSLYFQQVSATVRGALEPDLFRQAWQAVVDRHSALRTAFIWERRPEPFQVVYRQARLPWVDHDWRGLDARDQQAQLAALLSADRDSGFRLDRPPLMRLALVRMEDDRHEVVWSHHHLVLDGWSVPIVLDEVLTLYDQQRAGRAVRLDPPRPYREFISWLRRQADADAEAFWRDELNGISGATTIVDAAAPPEAAGVGELVRRVPAAQTAALAAFARDQHVTFNTLVQAAWALVLSAHSGDQEVLFGATVAGRPSDLAQSDRMVGLFINTLPVRVDVRLDVTVAAFLRDQQARQTARQRFEHSSLVAIHGWSGLPRDVPLFETLFVFENYPVDLSQNSRLATLTIDAAHIVERTNYPLTLVAAPMRELVLKIDFECGRFTPEKIAQILDHLEEMLEGIAANPNERIGNLPSLTRREHDRVVDWQAMQGPDSQLVHERFEAQAERTPDALAVQCGELSVTYLELNARANRLTKRLRAAGVAPETRVGVSVAPSIDMVVAVLAVLKAGAAYVPIATTDPEIRQRFVEDDADVRVVLIGGANGSAASGAGQTEPVRAGRRPVSMTVADDTLPAGTGDEGDDDGNISVPVSPDNLAYVIYTSGSTGQPKGVMVSHRGLANYLGWCIEAYDVAGGSGAPLHTPLGFDLTITSLFPPLLTGRTVEVIAQAGIDAFAETLCRRPGFSLIKITPAHLEALQHLLPPEHAGSAARTFVIGGEALLDDQLRFWREHAPHSRLINEYGPTETVVGCCVYEASQPVGSAAVPIGRPIANTELFILDRAMRPVPPGSAGELYIGGPGVARGYQGRPDATAERFVPHPDSRLEGARLYRSGDLARYRADGAIEFLGRIDRQIKLRGFRIEPSEVESALRRHPDLVDCAVVVQTGRPGDSRLVAFVAMRVVTGDGDGRLRAFAAAELPDYMVPAQFEVVEALPLTHNGKVDRQALAKRLASTVGEASATAAPRGMVEELLALIWREVLGATNVGRDDTFFELGGHSLLATQIVSRIRSRFRIGLPLRALFDAPTVAALAGRIEALQSQNGGRAELAPIRRSPEDGAPLSFAQQRLWFLHQLDPESSAYNVPYACRVSGALDVDVLKDSLDAIVARHEVLRARFEAVDGQPTQIIARSSVTPFAVLDLRHLPSDARDAEIRRLGSEQARRPFDLAQGPLLRAVVAQLDAQSWTVFLTMHHIVCDAWSAGILMKELAAFYQALAAGRPAPVRDLELQYADFAAWERAALKGPLFDRQLAYWKTQLADLPALDLPTDRRRPVVQRSSGAAVSFQLPRELTERVDALGRAEGVTRFMTLLAAFAVLLGRYAGQPDVAIGTPVANRSLRPFEDLIGLLTNTLVIRADLSGPVTFRALLRQLRDTTLDAHAHQDLPFERLVDELAPVRALSHHPLFQVMFTLTDGPPDALVLDTLRLTALAPETATAKFDLSLAMARDGSGGGLAGAFEYNTDLFDRETIERMRGHFATLLEQALTNPDRRIDTLRLLPEPERQLIAGWNDARVDHGPAATIVELLDAQVERTPQATALVFEESQLSYRELDRLSNQLAHFLIGRGVREDDLVGLCLDRSIDLVVGLLAILKAGAAYVPIDRSYPVDRIAYMLDDARAPFVLVDRALGGPAPARCETISLPAIRASLGEQPVDRPRGARTADSIAYVIYTSGSTGQPKGVMIPHRALRNHMQWMQRVVPLTPGDAVLQKTPISFDASVWEFFAPLLVGARLVLARSGGHQDPSYLVEAIRRHSITILQVVPSMLRLLLDAGGIGDCPSLRRVFSGGEVLTTDLQERFFAATTAELYNLYGPTEVTIDSIAARCVPGSRPRAVPIGRAIDNVTAFVVDADLALVPVGVIGDLYLGGVGLARGYVRQPALTAERFVPDPFGPSGSRLYCTGDRARWLASGELEFLGRGDEQVKIRGFRIEPGEVEAALAEHDAVRHAVVVAREDLPGVKRLVAYIVAGGVAIEAADLRRFLLARLPEHMIPAMFVTIESLPRLPNGKIDRRRLPAPLPDHAVPIASYIEPSNDIETALAAIWADVLGTSRVGVRSNFFELGADSILTLRVVARARAAGLQLSPTDIFLHQTVEALAAVTQRVTTAALQMAPASGAAVLTPIQRWFFEQPLAARHHWNQALLINVPANLDAAVLSRALDRVVAHHDALRLRFVMDTGEWRQEHAESVSVTVEQIDLGSLPAQDRAAAMTGAIDRLQGSLSLGQPPLMRTALFSRGADEPGRLLIVVHHLIIDGVSWRILFEDLARCYEQIEQGKPLDLPAKTVSFQDWAARLGAYGRSGAARHEIDYWTRREGRAPASLPRDLPADAAANTEGSAESIELWLSRDDTDRLVHEVPPVYNTQLSDVLLTALVEAIGEWSGERRLLVDLEGHGREDVFPGADVSRTIGWFTTLYPVTLDIRELAPGTAALRAIKEQIRAIPGRGFGYGVLRYLDPDGAVRDRLTALPRPEINFNYMGQVGPDADPTRFGPAPEPLGALRGPHDSRTHLLEIVATVVEHRLCVRWIYSCRLHRRDTIERLAAQYMDALRDVMDQCLLPDAGGYTSSDFGAVVSGRDLDKLMARLRQ